MAKSLNKSSIQNEIILNLYLLCFLKRFCCKITGRLVSQIQMKPSSVKNPLIKTSKRHTIFFLHETHPKAQASTEKKSYLFHLKRFHFIQKKSTHKKQSCYSSLILMKNLFNFNVKNVQKNLL